MELLQYWHRALPAALLAAIVVLGALDAVAQGGANGEQAAPAAVEEPQGPQSIPASQVAGRAQEARTLLAGFRLLAEPQEAMERVELQLPTIRAEIEQLGPESEIELTNFASQALVQTQRAQWQELGRELESGRKEAGERAVELRESIDELGELRVLWEKTSEQAVIEGLPPAVVSRIGDTLASILEVEHLLKSRRATVLTLQNEIGQSEEIAVEVLARLSEAERLFEVELFESKHAPLWKLVTLEQREGETADRRSVWAESSAVAKKYVEEMERRFVLFGGGFVLLLVVLIALGPRAAPLAEESPAFEPTAKMMGRPFAASLMVSMLFFPLMFELPPRSIAAAFWALLPIPFLRLLPVLIGKDMNPAIYGLTAWYALAWTRIFMIPDPSLARWMLFFEGLAVLAFLGFLLHPSRLQKLERSTQWLMTIRFGLLTSIVLLVASVIANAIGNVTLAQLLDEGTLVGHCIAVLVFGSLQIFGGILELLMRTSVVRRLSMVRHHAPLLRRRGRRLLGWAHFGLWAYITLDAFRIQEPVFRTVRGIFEARITTGDLDLSLGDVGAFGLMVWASFLISSFIRFVLDEDVLPRANLPRGVPFAISVLVRYTILLAGFMMAVAAAGLDMSRFALMIGALGVGIGIGLQDVVNNFVSGLILLFERPIQRGDTVEVGGVRGDVATIGLRASTLRTFEGAEMVIPNSQFVSASFVNWTLSDRQRRISVLVGVEYGTDPDRVLEILIDVARGEPKILNQPEPRALMLAFGESSLDFELRAWTAEVEAWMTIRSRLTVEINRALAEAGITIPFPQRDLHVRSVVEPN